MVQICVVWEVAGGNKEAAPAILAGAALFRVRQAHGVCQRLFVIFAVER
jgi:hypothetical protein